MTWIRNISGRKNIGISPLSADRLGFSARFTPLSQMSRRGSLGSLQIAQNGGYLRY